MRPRSEQAKADPARGKSKSKAKAGPQHGKVLPGQVRIIGGMYKRTKLPVPDKPGLRPTPDRVRETLFNWLGQDLTGWRCMDIFAGTGALGFEAASRGAAEVTLCEQDPQLVAKLKSLQERLQASAVRVERGDGVSLLRRQSPGSMQLVFIDPPFESALFEPAIKAAAEVLSAKGMVYLEAPRFWTADELAAYGLEIYRSSKAGAVHFHLLVRPGAFPAET